MSISSLRAYPIFVGSRVAASAESGLWGPADRCASSKAGIRSVGPGGSAVPGGRAALSVIFTTVHFTLPVLEVISRLGSDLALALEIIVPRPLPYSLPLNPTREIAPLVPLEIGDFLQQSGLEASILVMLCRTKYAEVPQSLRQHSTVLIGGRRRWYLSSEEQLERLCRALGHEVVFVEAGRRHLRKWKVPALDEPLNELRRLMKS